MSFLCDRIIPCIIQKFDMNNKIPTESKIVGKEREIEVDGCKLKINLKAESFQRIKYCVAKKMTSKFVEEKHAIRWIEKNIVGGITKDALDLQRKLEIDEADLL